MSAKNATLPKAVMELWKLGHRKDFGGQNPASVLKNRMPAVLTPDSVAEFVLSEIDKCLNGNVERAKPYYDRVKELLEL